MVPEYLYKVISLENWTASQSKDFLELSQNDAQFIHFSTEEQLPKVIKKFWSDVLQYVVLKIDPTQLCGRLIYEKNPGGTNRYYHLYDGSIPMQAVQEIKKSKNG